jgi:hypothetical protein
MLYKIVFSSRWLPSTLLSDDNYDHNTASDIRGALNNGGRLWGDLRSDAGLAKIERCMLLCGGTISNLIVEDHSVSSAKQ